MSSNQELQDAHRTRLIALCQEVLAGRKLILASNRGPVEYQLDEAGQIRSQRGGGGVVTALTPIGQHVKLTWIASAMGEGDRRVAQTAEGRRLRSPFPNQSFDIRFVVSPKDAYHKYYYVFSNPLLWFLQHYMWNCPHAPDVDQSTYDAWESGYVAVNRAFAEAILDEVRGDPLEPVVMLHDYHLYLAGGWVRGALPQAIIQHFTHIPWPAPGYWRLLPAFMREEIGRGLLASDVAGFQTWRDVHSFLHFCQTFLPEVEIDFGASTVRYCGHVTRVRAYPISVDAANLLRTMRSSRVQDYVAKLQPLRTEQAIVRVDRVEPSRNIVRGLKAYSLLLQRHPDLHRRVKFFAFLVPSRTRIREYQRYTDEIMRTIDLINERFGQGDWKPIIVFLENNYLQALAGMSFYDVLLVNPVIDGMSLVAKEGPVVNTRDGVLILSEAAGAHDQLSGGCLSVSPADIEGTEQALYQALTMPLEERKRRADLLRSVVEEEDITMWLYHQFSDLRPAP